MKKRIIFHLPLKIDPNRHSASQIRPMKMLQAFKDIGYEVDVVEGTAMERKKAIKEIKKNIREGIEYDFLYSESSTMPTLLTESHHLPTHPFLDFSFFKFCKKNGIRIGLFYRDIYWCFPEYTVGWKSKLAMYFYKYDVHKYNELVDVLFLPAKEMVEFMPIKFKKAIIELPPGVDMNKFTDIANQNLVNNGRKATPFEIFYVGGIGNHYNLKMIVEAVGKLSHIHLTICCRQPDWEIVKKEYLEIMPANVTVIHKAGVELEEYYNKAHLCVLFVEPIIYWTFAIPYKLFEFIGHGKPILASKGTKVAKFVEQYNCGLVVDYNADALKQSLDSIDYKKLVDIQKMILEFAPTHTWKARAIEVCQTLKKK